MIAYEKKYILNNNPVSYFEIILIVFLFIVLVKTSFTQTATWDGSSSTDWNTAANWSTNAVPTSSNDVIIPNVTNNPIIIIVSNPMDSMTYLALKSSGLDKNRIIGMGGALDSSRFKTYISLALNKPANDIHAMVIGGHGDTTMIPLTRLASYNGINISELLEENKLAKVAADTMVGGKTLTGMLGTSAWYAPGAAVSYLVDSILNDQKRIIPCSVFLEGEYGQSDICIGVPVIIGKNGWENILELDLDSNEKDLFTKSADAVRNMNGALNSI